MQQALVKKHMVIPTVDNQLVDNGYRQLCQFFLWQVRLLTNLHFFNVVLLYVVYVHVRTHTD